MIIAIWDARQLVHAEHNKHLSQSHTLSLLHTLSLTHSLDIIDLGEQRKMEKDRWWPFYIFRLKASNNNNNDSGAFVIIVRF